MWQNSLTVHVFIAIWPCWQCSNLSILISWSHPLDYDPGLIDSGTNVSWNLTGVSAKLLWSGATRESYNGDQNNHNYDERMA